MELVKTVPLATFLPKFDNVSDNKMISSRTTFHDISIKYSGSCFMVSGYDESTGIVFANSKNAYGNKFTRVSLFLIAKQFELFFPDNPSAFEFFLSYLRRHRITVSFETVVPKVLGAHGATPKRSFLVMTNVSAPSLADPSRRINLDCAQRLQFAARWRLPIPESIFCDSIDFLTPEMRSSMTSSRFQALTSILGTENSIIASFAPHSLMQGEVQEGVVIQSFMASIDIVKREAEIYNATMAPFLPTYLDATVISEQILLESAGLEAGGVEILRSDGSNFPLKEAQPYVLSDEYEKAFIDSTPMLQLLFKTYRSKLVLRSYLVSETEVRIHVMTQIEVTEDNVFYMFSGIVAPSYTLPRGLVFEIEYGNSEIGEIKGYTDPVFQPCLIQKRKFMLYLLFTFGIRNKLPLIGRPNMTFDKQGHVHRLCRIWKFDESIRPAVHRFLVAVYDAVEKMKPAERTLLKANYLEWAEPFFWNNVASNALRTFFDLPTSEETVSFLNLSVVTLISGDTKEAWEERYRIQAGYVSSRPPQRTSHEIAVCFDETIDKAGTGILASLRKVYGEKLLENPTTEYLVQLASQSIEVVVADKLQDVENRVFLFAGIPVGGGKSTMSTLLQRIVPNSSIVSSDASGGEANFIKKITNAIKNGQNVVVDTNIMNIKRLAKVLGFVKRAEMNVLVSLIVPTMLPPFQFFQKRVSARVVGNSNGSTFVPSEVSNWTERLQKDFYAPCVEFLPFLKSLECIFPCNLDVDVRNIDLRNVMETPGLRLDKMIDFMEAKVASPETEISSFGPSAYFMASIENIPDAHVTIYFPAAEKNESLSVQCRLLNGHWGTLTLTGTRLKGTRESNGKKESIALFPVACMESDDGLLVPENPLYHVTDQASLGSCKAACAKEVLAQHLGLNDTGWMCEETTVPATVFRCYFCYSF